jgi:6-phosphofructokinase 1
MYFSLLPLNCYIHLAGFIAMYATLASRDVDCCLIPESPFYMDGEGGLLQYVERRLKENKHMVIVVAEGAGQDLIAKSLSTSEQQDASGNKLLLDIGLWLTHKIKVHKTLNFASEFRSAALVNIGN